MSCDCAYHTNIIDMYYDSIVNMLKRSTVGCVPKIPVRCLKEFWNDDLDRLKAISCDLHALWRSIGSPRHGVINSARLNAKLEYKLAIKEAAKNFEMDNADELNMRFVDKDCTSFWKCWSSKYNSSLSNPVSIDSQSDPTIIADTFKNLYAGIYIDSAKDASAVNECNELRASMTSDSIPICIDIEAIQRCVLRLKCNKAAGHDGISAEHILNSHPAIILHLKFLFSMMLSHSYVPRAFGTGIIIPIIKDKRGNVNSVDNYRPITLSPIVSKIFESFLLDKYAHLMLSDDLQFGFKKNLGCSNAIFALRQCVEYFNNRNSNVYIASLDASKAFDRVNHYKLFTTLIKCGLPKFFVETIINWYSKLTVAVRWNGSYSSSTLPVLSGVRQGGILSPIFLNVYINCMISNLRRLDYGCHVRNIFLGCIMYADDLLLMSASVIELQHMLNVCANTAGELDIKFNATKSVCIMIGPWKCAPPEPMWIDDGCIQWVERVKYLGVTLLSGLKFSVDFAEIRRKYFTAVNSILNKCKYVSELVKLELLESHCLPIILYAVESLNLNKSQLNELNCWWNSAYRKIFNYNQWESVKHLICHLGRLNLFFIINLRRILFIKRLIFSENTVMSSLLHYYLRLPELVNIQNALSVDLSWSSYKIKACVNNAYKILYSEDTDS